MDSVVEIACKRNPLLALCKAVSPIEPGSSLDQKVEPLSVQISDVFSNKNTVIFQNSTTTVSALGSIEDISTIEGSDNPEITNDTKVDTSLNESSLLSDDQEDHEVFIKVVKESYCQEYIPKYDFYCQGPGRYTVSEEDQQRLVSFCLSVKENCLPVSLVSSMYI